MIKAQSLLGTPLFRIRIGFTNRSKIEKDEAKYRGFNKRLDPLTTNRINLRSLGMGSNKFNEIETVHIKKLSFKQEQKGQIKLK